MKNNKHRTRFVCLFFVVMLSACGGSPTSPSSQFPNVAGTYTGTLALTQNSVLIANVYGRMQVVQYGSQITITASMTVNGVEISLPASTGNINQTGYYTATASGGASETSYDPDCGYLVLVSQTLTFSGNNANYVEVMNSDFCGQLRLSGTLVR